MGRPKKEKPNRKDGRYEVKVTIGYKYDGSPIRKSFYSKKSKADALAKAEQFKIDTAVTDITGEVFSSHDISFSVWSQKWLNSIRGTIKNSTFDKHYYSVIHKHLMPFFGKRSMQSIKQMDIQLYFNTKADSMSYETLRIHKTCLYRIFESASLNDIIQKNPVYRIAVKSNVEPKEKQAYSQQQFETVLEYCKSHKFGAEIATLLLCGISRSELLGIRWEDIDFENCIIHIRQGVTEQRNPINNKIEVVVGDLKTKYRKRDIPVDTMLIDMINNIPRKSEYVFCTKHGQVYRPGKWREQRYNIFMRDLTKEHPDIPILSPHELRHTRATLLVNSEANLYAVAAMLGHSDLSMLRKHYLHSDIEALRDLLKLEKLKPDDKNTT